MKTFETKAMSLLSPACKDTLNYNSQAQLKKKKNLRYKKTTILMSKKFTATTCYSCYSYSKPIHFMVYHVLPFDKSESKKKAGI